MSPSASERSESARLFQVALEFKRGTKWEVGSHPFGTPYINAADEALKEASAAQQSLESPG